MVAPGATACTISASTTSSPLASQGEAGAGQAGHDPQPRGGQAEQAVEPRQVLADVGDHGRAQAASRRVPAAPRSRRGRRSRGPAAAGCRRPPGAGAGYSRSSPSRSQPSRWRARRADAGLRRWRAGGCRPGQTRTPRGAGPPRPGPPPRPARRPRRAPGREPGPNLIM